jgi:hypothetical protein
MARPTKEEKEKREKIKSLELIKRDTFIYTRFEDRAKEFSTSIISYMFCSECQKRDNNINLDEFTKNGNFYKRDPIINEKLKSLYDIDKFMAFHLLCLYGTDYYKSLTEEDFKFYKVQNLSIELQEFEKWSQPHQIRLIHKNYTPYNPYRLNDTQENAFNLDEVQKVNKVYAELDLSKPLEELIEFVTMIKEEYNENSQNIYNHDFKPYKCELSDCDIYKSKNTKPIYGRLADVIFIYDCKKLGFDNDYIKDEINRYWQEVKNLFKDSFGGSTLIDYHEFGKKYIDNKKYQSFTCGYDLSKII